MEKCITTLTLYALESSKPPKFKNRSERNAGYITDAMRIFGGKEMINERPPYMHPDEYRVLRKMQSEILKQLFHKGKSPSRKLQHLMPIKQSTIRITAPKKKNIPRRTQ